MISVILVYFSIDVLIFRYNICIYINSLDGDSFTLVKIISGMLLGDGGVFQSQVCGGLRSQARQNRHNFTLLTTAITKEHSFKHVLSCVTRPLDVFLCLNVFQPEPNLSNSFLYILLANNTVRGEVRLGY